MIFTRNIKVSVRCTDGELVFEFQRPTNKDRNAFIAESLNTRTGDDLATLEHMDSLRCQMFDKFVQAVYVEKDGKREDVTDESGAKMDPKSFPDDVKAKAAARAFEYNTFQAKNF
jgi:hypothetical protein